MDLVYFSGPTKQKNPLLKDNIFLYAGSLKYTSFFKVSKKQLVYFSGPQNFDFGVH